MKEIFDEKDAKIIAKEFSGVLKKLGEAFSKLAKAGIAHESKFLPKEGKLTVRLFKEKEYEY